MEERFQHHPGEVKKMDTLQLREAFIISGMMQDDQIHFTYSHYDRMVIGGIVPVTQALPLETYDHFKSDFFLQRREMGIINIGGEGEINADGIMYSLSKLDCLYLGRDTKLIRFNSKQGGSPAKFYILSSPAHKSHPNMLMKNAEATAVELGDTETSNRRTIYKYIHEDGIKSCQLVMGLTVLKNGSVWNTMPAHTHHRRMEVYMYFDIKENQRVFHLMGQPVETRHLVLGNHDAVISAPWSVHSGCGTSNYSFIWGMAGENQSFSDMDPVGMSDIQ